MTLLDDLNDAGQSPWLDNLRRDWIHNGELQNWLDKGVRGITSNPSIFQKAISGSEEYTEQFTQLLAEGKSIEESYWGLVTTDIEDALTVMRPVYDQTDGLDGYVSVEVDPSLARDGEGTAAAARALDDQITAPNLYVKIPATDEGTPTIGQMIAEGRSINVTLLFAIDKYQAVMDAYIDGLEKRVADGGDISDVSSVASFFISRIDVEVDKRLEAIGTPEAKALIGKVAIANAKLAYQAFVETFSGPRWEALEPRAPASSAFCGHPPPPRTRRFPTPSTSTRSSAPIRSTPFPTRPSRHFWPMAPSPAPSTPISMKQRPPSPPSPR